MNMPLIGKVDVAWRMLLAFIKWTMVINQKCIFNVKSPVDVCDFKYKIGVLCPLSDDELGIKVILLMRV